MKCVGGCAYTVPPLTRPLPRCFPSCPLRQVGMTKHDADKHGSAFALYSSIIHTFPRQVGVIKRDADERGTAFNGRPFLRVLAGLVSELTSAGPVDDAAEAASSIR